MAEYDGDILETPDLCDETVEYENSILDSIDITPEESEEDSEVRKKWEEIEQKFARYERNYRIRRIKELTRSPINSRKKGRRGSTKLLA